MPFKFICKYALSLHACGCYICLSIWKHAGVIYVRAYVCPHVFCVCACESCSVYIFMKGRCTYVHCMHMCLVIHALYM